MAFKERRNKSEIKKKKKQKKSYITSQEMQMDITTCGENRINMESHRLHVFTVPNVSFDRTHTELNRLNSTSTTG